MRIRFHGPLGTVTGSCYEVIDEKLDIHFLVDCGMQQGEPNADVWNRRRFRFDPADLDFVVLTHAHLDHCGRIPILYRRGFDGPVYCTKATAELATLVLHDALKHDAPFSAGDIARIQWVEHGGKLLGKPHHVTPGLRLTYLRSAHILGSISVQIGWGPRDEGKRIVFSGDIGNNTQGSEFQPLLRHSQTVRPPRSPHSFVVMEATYGSRPVSEDEKDVHVRLGKLLEHIEHTTLVKGGTVVMPCFAINRTQDVLFDLHYLFATHPELAQVPVYFDAGMARTANQIYAERLARNERVGTDDMRPIWLNERLFEWLELDSRRPEEFDVLTQMLRVMLLDDERRPLEFDKHYSRIVRRWKRIWKPACSFNHMPSEVGGACIIVTGGGMCSGGPIVNYLEALLGDERHTILMTGYCSPASTGGILQDLADLSSNNREELSGELRLSDKTGLKLADIRADIATLGGYSGHADQTGLINWFFPDSHDARTPVGWTAFLTHGTEPSRRALRSELRLEARRRSALQNWNANALNIELPDDTRHWFDLDAARWLTPGEPSAAKSRALQRNFEGLSGRSDEFTAESLQA